MTKKEWKKFTAYGLDYEANREGEIRQTSIYKNGEKISGTWILREPTIGANGSAYFHMRGLHGETKTKYMHYLMAELFVENPDGYQFAAPKDGNYLNYRVENLEWRPVRPYNSNNSNMTPDKIKRIKEEFRSESASIAHLMRKYRATRTMIERALS